jgi:hypothetical protein
MKKFKKIIGIGLAGLIATAMPLFITAFSVTAPVAMTGCGALSGGNGTNTANQAQIDATALILQNSARAGAIAAITPPTGDTNNAAYFQLASQALGAFITGTNYSPAAFQDALLKINVPQAKNVWVQLGIGAVIDLYQVYFSQYVQGQLNGNMAAGTFLLAIQNGFNQALGQPLTPVPSPVVNSGNLQLGHGVSGSVLPRPLKK